MQWSFADIDTEPSQARSPTEVNDKCQDYSNSDPSSRRQAPVESVSLPEIFDLVPDAEGGFLSEECDDVQKSRGAGTRSCVSSFPARWQTGGRRVQRRKRATAGAEVRMGFFLDDDTTVCAC